MSVGAFQATVRLTPAKITDLLDRLDEASEKLGAAGCRGKPRTRFRITDQRVLVKQPGGSLLGFLVCTRDVSTTGIGFIHGGYLHPGTRCVFDVVKPDGERGVSGSITYSLLVEGGIHACGAKFDEEIDIGVFLALQSSPGAGSKGAESKPASHSGEPASRVVILSDQTSHAAWLEFQLKAQHAAVSIAPSLAVLEEIIGGLPSPADLVLVDGSVGGEPAARIVEEVFVAHSDISVVAMTGDDSPVARAALVAAGAIHVLTKPCPAQKFKHIVEASIVRTRVGRRAALTGAMARHAVSASGPLRSTLEADKGFDPLITRFVDDVHALGSKLAESARGDQRDEVRRICHSLKGACAGYGFAVVGMAAARAMNAIEAAEGPLEAVEEIRELESLCRRVAGRAAA